MYTLNTQVHLDLITEAEMDSALLAFWLRFFSNNKGEWDAPYKDTHQHTVHYTFWAHYVQASYLLDAGSR
jgi:hypothetical protein